MRTEVIPGGFHVPCDTHLGKWQKETGRLCHDDFLPWCAAQYIKPGDTVLDIGAFNGDHTILYCALVGESGKVIAFEPGNVAFDCLFMNAQLFPFNNVLPVKMALSDGIGKMSHQEDPNLGASHCFEVKEGDISSISLDQFLDKKEVNKIDYIKIDSEGFESKILRGGAKTIERCSPVMMIEVNPSALQLHGSSEDQLFDILHSMGYSSFIVQPDIKPNEPQYDIICERIQGV